MQAQHIATRSFTLALGRALAAAVLLAPMLPAAAEDLPDVCTALQTIVAAPSFGTLAQSRPLLPAGSPGQGACRGSAHAYDCRWRAHWGADGGVADPLQELGADIASCFPDVRHDINSATRQHFVLRTADTARVTTLTATIEGANTVRLRVVR